MTERITEPKPKTFAEQSTIMFANMRRTNGNERRRDEMVSVQTSPDRGRFNAGRVDRTPGKTPAVNGK